MSKNNEPLPPVTWREFVQKVVVPVIGAAALVVAVQTHGLLRWVCFGIYAAVILHQNQEL